MNPKFYLKAVLAALVAGLAVLTAQSDGGVTFQEWLQAASAALAAGGATYFTPNAETRVNVQPDVVNPTPQDDGLDAPQ